MVAVRPTVSTSEAIPRTTPSMVKILRLTRCTVASQASLREASAQGARPLPWGLDVCSSAKLGRFRDARAVVSSCRCASCSMSCPSCIRSTRSQCSATSGSWVITIVLCWSPVHSRSRSMTSRVSSSSSEPVGSSQSSNAGSPMSARAIATRCFSPPERVVMGASVRWLNPSRARVSSTRCARSALGTPR